jgi:hypothetical protein
VTRYSIYLSPEISADARASAAQRLCSGRQSVNCTQGARGKAAISFTCPQLVPSARWLPEQDSARCACESAAQKGRPEDLKIEATGWPGCHRE